MSITHLAAIGSLLSMLLLLVACQGIEVKPTSPNAGRSSYGAGSSGHD
ncbi:MAG: hypothetical protein JF625_05600 [Inquilinus limosus]|uniref:Lipoprotein n=1 Tax=Inquilinus limosus TaxID=171674 RepID=A0A952FHS1_9PROT|nr:hypothetical protein [Inquilinus limosus]